MSVFGIKAAAQEQQIMVGTMMVAPIVTKKWEKPQHPWVKINIDAALFADIECISLGR